MGEVVQEMKVVGWKGLSDHLPLSVCVSLSLSHSSSFHLRLPLLTL